MRADTRAGAMDTWNCRPMSLVPMRSGIALGV